MTVSGRGPGRRGTDVRDEIPQPASLRQMVGSSGPSADTACELPPVSRHGGRTQSGDTDMGILTWIIVGLIAGVLASLVMGGTGYGLVGDIIIGIIGAFVGGWLFSALGVGTPFGGLAGTIFVAFIGAVVLLFILRAIRGGRRRVV